MAWGALATGARAATGSTGQGLALMQESFSEITRAELPLVVFHMARGQGDYFQATRGGGHGDYRHVVLAPIDVHEAVALTQLAFDLADRWRNPVQLYGDFLLAHTAEAVTRSSRPLRSAAAKDWAVDGSLGGSGRSRNVNPIGMTKGAKGIEPEPFWKRLQAKHDEIERREVRFESEAPTTPSSWWWPSARWPASRARRAGAARGRASAWDACAPSRSGPSPPGPRRRRRRARAAWPCSSRTRAR